ncbi:unnamed protein product [Toxocara canis]|uniref:Uncharacterized protein n=1 Tax=Toxocara canis TaxID=6265 RepID=A0A183USF5_TOXCA|nr:unnamed protein product [Toxocara canis]
MRSHDRAQHNVKELFAVLAIITGVYGIMSLIMTAALLACCICQMGGSGGAEVVEKRVEKTCGDTTEDGQPTYQ